MERTNSNRKAQLQKNSDCKQVEKRKRWIIQTNTPFSTDQVTITFDKPTPRPFHPLDMDRIPSTDACRDYYRDARRAVRRLASKFPKSSAVYPEFLELAEQAMERVLKAEEAVVRQAFRDQYDQYPNFGGPMLDLMEFLPEIVTPLEEVISKLEDVALDIGVLASLIVELHTVAWPRFPRVDPLPADHKLRMIDRTWLVDRPAIADAN